MNNIITLLSDFGRQDVYVGVMKGAIATINPHLNLIDLTHEIPPQNLQAASFALQNAYPYFPPNTVHLAVVDPGVGSQRKAIAVGLDRGFLVGPDNGIFSGIYGLDNIQAAVELDNPKYWRGVEVSTTFHGRDIFAPVAAHLAGGVAISQLGTAIDDWTSLVRLPPFSSQPTVEIITPSNTTLIAGTIQYVDRFGNLITNISGSQVQHQPWRVKIGDTIISSGTTYSDVPPHNAIALIGSDGWVEIAVNGGSAKQQLNIDICGNF